tara:strand:- start:456 stop:1358 length:903 start_codon:yes stop_codon:yes gene_type:complete
MHPETRLFLINKHLQENVLVKSAAKPVTKVLARRVGAGAASSGARTGAIQLARNVRPGLGQAARAGTTALALRRSGGGRGTGGGGRGTRPPAGGGDTPPPRREPLQLPDMRPGLTRGTSKQRRQVKVRQAVRKLGATAKAGIDTLRKQQSGIYGDLAAQGLNIGSSRRIGPEFGTTGTRSARRQGVANIGGFVRTTFGTGEDGAPGAYSPVGAYMKVSDRLARRQEKRIKDRMGRGEGLGFLGKMYKYGTYRKPSDSIFTNTSKFGETGRNPDGSPSTKVRDVKFKNTEFRDPYRAPRRI